MAGRRAQDRSVPRQCRGGAGVWTPSPWAALCSPHGAGAVARAPPSWFLLVMQKSRASPEDSCIWSGARERISTVLTWSLAVPSCPSRSRRGLPSLSPQLCWSGADWVSGRWEGGRRACGVPHCDLPLPIRVIFSFFVLVCFQP